MRIIIYPMLVFFLLSATAPATIGQSVQDTVSGPTAGMETQSRIVVVNAFDIKNARFRKNKASLFYRLADTLLQDIRFRLALASNKTVVLTGHQYYAAGTADSSLLLLENSQQASWALVVKSIDAGFEQDKVEVTHDEGGTHRQARYNIFSEVLYQLYDRDSLLSEKRVRIFHYHSTRSVMSGLFAVGPNIVDNEPEAIAIVKENENEFCFKYFPRLK